jgi:membrane associated rhomboid family serine protease
MSTGQDHGTGGGGTGQEPVAVPVCPRHPSRESYVRCQRCERPTCPECQRPAAVGIQCVDCVREQSKGVRPARTVFGGTAALTRQGTAPPRVTISIIGICIAVFIAQLTIGDPFTSRFLYAPFLTEQEPWRMITSAFLHSPDSFLHILFNMYALWLVGPYLERLFGAARFLALYLICAFGGSVGYLLLASSISGAYGASGAVFGLFAAFAIVQRRLKRDAGMIYALIAINFVIGFLPGWNIAWQAHLGGLITGALATAVLVYAPRDRRTAAQAGGLAAVTLILLLLTVAKVSLNSSIY